MKQRERGRMKARERERERNPMGRLQENLQAPGPVCCSRCPEESRGGGALKGISVGTELGPAHQVHPS